MQKKKGKRGRSRKELEAFRRTILSHYRLKGREMPWRTTRDPYAIFVSEYMLQQTQVSRVLPKYEVFLRRFPTFQSLALAPLGDVLRCWQGLGYNRRARALHDAAKRVVEEHGGKLPASREKLEELPGIGSYTAGALLAFVFNVPVVCIETNIRSVYIHHFFPGRGRVSDTKLLPLIESTVDRTNPRHWYYALMDYGSYIKSERRDINARSLHYVRQSPFAGSQRQLRGIIVRMAGRKEGSLFANIAEVSGRKVLEVQSEALRLKDEGLVVVRGGRVLLP